MYCMCAMSVCAINVCNTSPLQNTVQIPYITMLHMVGFQNVFSQNGALIAIPWGPASKSPLNFNHTQTTGMLNMKACELQKL